MSVDRGPRPTVFTMPIAGPAYHSMAGRREGVTLRLDQAIFQALLEGKTVTIVAADEESARATFKRLEAKVAQERRNPPSRSRGGSI